MGMGSRDDSSYHKIHKLSFKGLTVCFSDKTGQIHSCFALALNERPGLEVGAVK